MTNEEYNSVVKITTKNFDEIVTSDNIVLISFYAPWAGHWQSIQDEYCKKSLEFKEKGSDISLGMVNATTETKLAEKYEISMKDFPKFMLFKNGRPISYEGEIKMPAILDWLEKETGPPAKLLTTVEELQAFINTHKEVVIGNFEHIHSDKAKPFLNAAADIVNKKVGLCSSNIGAEIGLPNDSVVLMTPYRDGMQTLDISDTERIKRQVIYKSHPFVWEYSDDVSPKIFGSKIKQHLLLFASKSSPNYQTLLDELEATSKEYEGKLTFVVIDTDLPDNSRISDFFNINESTDIPTVRLMKLSDGENVYYSMNEPYTTDNYRIFIDSFLNGELKPDSV